MILPGKENIFGSYLGVVIKNARKKSGTSLPVINSGKV